MGCPFKIVKLFVVLGFSCKWRTSCGRHNAMGDDLSPCAFHSLQGHLGPEEELLAFKEMLAVTIKHDLQLEQLCCMAIPVMAQLHAAILARNATRDGLASRMQEESAVMQLHAAQARVTELCRTLYRQLQELIALEKEALTFDSTRLLPWASKIFDKKLSEHALQVLLFGDIMPLREAASVSRWTLRNQSDPRSKQVRF